jgi:hypothetical protein
MSITNLYVNITLASQGLQDWGSGNNQAGLPEPVVSIQQQRYLMHVYTV